MKQIKLFISYAHRDEGFKDELLEHMSILLRNGTIKEWNDRQLLPGQDWDDTIKKHLEESQIVLFLVSSSFLNSDYINDVEIKHTLERHERKEVVIIPIIIRRCLWQGSKLSRFQALPKNANPIASWSDKDEAYYDVVQGLKNVIDRLEEVLPPHRHPKPPMTTSSPTQTSNTNADFGKKAQELITKDKIKDAIELLMDVAEKKDKDIYNQLILILSRYNSLRKGRFSYISDNDYETGIAKIQFSLLDIISDLQES